MKILKILLFFQYLLLKISAEDADAGELVAVTTIIRHGQRIPLSRYPTDPNRNVTWPFNLGDLTNEGMRQLFDVGTYLRKRYTPHFISSEYVPKEMYALSAEFDRCLDSAEAAFAGLYPPIKNEIWNNYVHWQPIPIHSSPYSQDIIANMLNPCPQKLAAVGEAVKKQPYYPEIMAEFRPILHYISARSGQKTTLTSLYGFFDTLFSEKDIGLAIPPWAEDIYPELTTLIKQYTELNSITLVERKIQIGPLVTRIVQQFDRAISGDDFGTTDTVFRKLMAYFSTEWLLYDFTYGVGLENIGIPHYGAFYLVELRRRHGVYYIHFLYKSDTSLATEAVPWKIVGQDFNLEYETFKKLVQPLMTNTNDWVPLCDNFVDALATVVENVPMS